MEPPSQPDEPAAKRRSPLPLLLPIVALALALRLWGIGWGLPDQHKLFSYHPDEGVNLVQGVLENGTFRPHLDLGFYNYGSLYFYGWQAAEAVNLATGAVRLPPTGDPENPVPDSPAAMILIGRLLSALAGMLTVVAVFALGNRVFGSAAGVVAAFIYAVIPAAVVHAHFATVDVAATLLVTLALVYGARILDTGSRRDVVLAGLFSGLAAATKYNTVLVVASPLAALILRKRAGKPTHVSLWGWLIGSTVGGFVLACPGSLIDWPRFSSDFLYELTKSGQGMGLLFTETGNGWLFHLTSSLRFGLGVPLLVLAVVGLILALTRRTRQDWYLLAFFVLYYAVIGAAQVRFLRYVMPLLPVLSLLAGRLIVDCWQRRTLIARAAGAIGAAAVLATLVVTFTFVRVMSVPDARDQALSFIQKSIPQGRVIAFARTPWYDMPPLSPGFTAPSPGARSKAARTLGYYTARLPAQDTELDIHVLDPPLSDVVLLSDIQTQDWDRLNVPAWREFRAVLEKSYTPHVFENTPRFAGIDLGKPTYVPHDLLYIYPRITVYTRR